MQGTNRVTASAESKPGFGVRASQQIATSTRLQISLFLLGLLLLYLLIRQVLNPGFSEYWGYSVVQLMLAMGLFVVLSVFLSDRGGISRLSQSLMVLVIYADTLGTAEDFYHRFSGYDKIIHTLGSAAVTSIIGDVLVALDLRGSISWPPRRILLVAAGIAIGGGFLWEVYEYLGDTVLNTGRHISATDTKFDLLSDTVGGIIGALLIYWQYFRTSRHYAVNHAGHGIDQESGRRSPLPE